MSAPLARSAQTKKGVRAQTYEEHVSGVRDAAMRHASSVGVFSVKHRDALAAVVRVASIYHDLGKLDDFFQDILIRNNHDNCGFNHCEAGTAELLKYKQGEAALLVYSHHIGLPEFAKEKVRVANEKNFFLRDCSQFPAPHHERTNALIEIKPAPHYERTDAFLKDYLDKHRAIFPEDDAKGIVQKFGASNLARRVALSCLVDADHGNSAQHTGDETALSGIPLRAADRLQALDNYVANLAATKTPSNEQEHERHALRQKIYTSCRERKLADNERIVSCDSPVGTGKTTAVLAHLLRVAAERNLRRIFVVLPFTTIIDQSVGVYRKALVLPGEEAEKVVAAHHHKVEFSGDDHAELRQLAQTWEAPIIVTTAVQFFETLAANKPAALRKLHQIAGSAVFVDETHAAMPAALWPQMWRWLCELADDWSCHFVLASGSLARFWELEDFVPGKNRRDIPRLVADADAQPAFDAEKKRVRLAVLKNKNGAVYVAKEDLADAVLAAPGPRLVVFNTVQSAAVFARYLREERNLGLNIEHLSTALTPFDRNRILQRIKTNLASHWKDWVLVATSCVEAGVDFSFRTGFRERAAFANLLQLAGRVNRNNEHSDAFVYDFQHNADEQLTLHPHFKTAAKIVGQLFENDNGANELGPEQCTKALQMELNQSTGEMEETAENIREAESVCDFPKVAKLCRLITTATTTVLVGDEICKRFENKDRKNFPTSQEIMLNSVQIWDNKLKDISVSEIGFGTDLLRIQSGCYDNFLGYMKGLLGVRDFQQNGSCF
ncbi:MAG: DEAD/DEAH box helicase family protein [Puniceicoccales bacterium]|jgi:CRISPR-associated endonuclease/helicase Cas3|nr:DEAD/DEAH box helicase family protein [Puniceicoccales bacterium]